MNLGVLLNLGESLHTLSAAGQDKRLVNYYLKNYVKEFEKVYLFSYAKENYKLPKGSVLITNKLRLHRFIYAFLMPILHLKKFKDCDVLRVTHLLGSIPAIIAKIFYGKRFVVTYGYDYKKFSRLEGKWYLVPLISLIEFLNFKLAEGIIVTYKEVHNYVSRRVCKDKILNIPNGVDVRLFKPKSKVKGFALRDSFGMQKSKVKILFVGRLEKQKNLFILIKAVSLLENKKKILLKFVGDGSLRKALKQYAKKLGVNLKIIKKIPYDKMPRVYQQADIFVLPSLAEGHVKVLLEAMACGLVCIGNNIKAIKSLIQNNKNGLIFDNSSNSLKKTLEKTLSGKLAAKISKKAREFIVENFDFQKLIKKEIEILKLK